MSIKKLLEKVVYYITVPKCVCCGDFLKIEDKALCKTCAAEHFKKKEEKCGVCLKPLPSCTCKNSYLERHFVKKLVKLFRYKMPLEEGKPIPSNELIYNVKRTDRKDLVDFIAAELCEAITANVANYKDFTVTSIPRKKSRVIKYGHDHSKVIAKAVAKRLGIKYATLLVSRQSKAQKKTSGEERFKNAEFDYKRGAKLASTRVLLFDDIVTTGASMGHCAALLRGLGSKYTIGVVLGIAFRDGT